MTHADALNKVRKLLRLADSGNANEAALAAAKAQELIDRFQLTTALAALADASTAPVDEPIMNFTDSPIDARPQIDRWRGYLAMRVCKYNACKVYQSGGTLKIIGRPTDAETVRYLYTWLAGEVERLAARDGIGQGRTWRNNYRLGVVETIGAKLKAQHDAFRATVERETVAAAELTGAAPAGALVLVRQALAHVEHRAATVDAWQKSNFKLGSASASRTRYDSGARAAGRRAGESIGFGRGALGAGGRKMIGAVLLAAVLLASPATAQDVTTIADKSTIETLAFEPLGGELLVPAELDGVASSREWIQYRERWDGATEIRGVALRGGRLCTGEYFDPLGVVPARHDGGVTALIASVAGVDRLVVQGPVTYAEVAIRFGCVR